MDKGAKPTRTRLEFSGRSWARLENLSKATGQTPGYTVQQALRLYELFLFEVDRDSQFFIRTPAGEETRVIML